MNIYQQEIIDEAIAGLKEFYPVLNLPAVRERVGNKVNVNDSGNRQNDYISIRDQIEDDLNLHTEKDTAAYIIDNYPKGECPDCFEDIPKDVEEGDECANCTHTFTSFRGTGLD